MKQVLLKLLVSGFFAFKCVYVFACDDFEIEKNSITLIEGLYVMDLSVTVERKNSNKTCQFVVNIDKGQQNNGSYSRYIKASAGGRNTIPIQFWDPLQAFTVKDFSDVSPPQESFSGSFTQKNEPNKKVLFYRILWGAVEMGNPKGSYSNTFTFTMHDKPLSGGSWKASKTRSQSFSFSNPAKVDVSVVGAGGAFNSDSWYYNVDFGRIELNQEKYFDFLVRNNASFRYTITSDNAGYMVRAGSSPQNNSRIKYRLRMSGNSVSSAVDIDTFSYTSPWFSPQVGAETRFPFTVKIMESTKDKKFGTYTDWLVINVTAQ